MNPNDIAALTDADSVRDFLVRAFGSDLAADRGTIHTAAVWDGPHGARVLNIGEHSPKSATDSFLLHLARARADAIVTTGKILRAEPELRYDLGATAGFASALESYRKKYVGLSNRARVVVLTRGEGIDFAHRAFHGWAEPVIFVPEAAPKKLDERAAINGIRVMRFPILDLDHALEALSIGGASTISIEAGIETTGPRYANGRGFDELMLTRFLEPSIDSRAIGAPFPDRSELEHIYGPPIASFDVEEASGGFRIERYRTS